MKLISAVVWWKIIKAASYHHTSCWEEYFPEEQWLCYERVMLLIEFIRMSNLHLIWQQGEEEGGGGRKRKAVKEEKQQKKQNFIEKFLLVCSASLVIDELQLWRVVRSCRRSSRVRVCIQNIILASILFISIFQTVEHLRYPLSLIKKQTYSERAPPAIIHSKKVIVIPGSSKTLWATFQLLSIYKLVSTTVARLPGTLRTPYFLMRNFLQFTIYIQIKYFLLCLDPYFKYKFSSCCLPCLLA